MSTFQSYPSHKPHTASHTPSHATSRQHRDTIHITSINTTINQSTIIIFSLLFWINETISSFFFKALRKYLKNNQTSLKWLIVPMPLLENCKRQDRDKNREKLETD